MSEQQQEKRQERKQEKLVVLATKRIKSHPELYQIIDMCNRTLKERGVMFGLSKTGPEEMTVTIYEM